MLRLLDSTFGFLVGAGHLLAIYISTAIACQLGLGSASEAARTSFLTGLTLLTIAVAAAIILHAALRFRSLRPAPDQRFRLTVTIGCDAIATVAVLWQLFPILLTPVCA